MELQKKNPVKDALSQSQIMEMIIEAASFDTATKLAKTCRKFYNLINESSSKKVKLEVDQLYHLKMDYTHENIHEALWNFSFQTEEQFGQLVQNFPRHFFTDLVTFKIDLKLKEVKNLDDPMFLLLNTRLNCLWEKMVGAKKVYLMLDFENLQSMDDNAQIGRCLKLFALDIFSSEQSNHIEDFTISVSKLGIAIFLLRSITKCKRKLFGKFKPFTIELNDIVFFDTQEESRNVKYFFSLIKSLYSKKIEVRISIFNSEKLKKFSEYFLSQLTVKSINKTMVTYQNFGINVSIEGLPDYNYTKCDTRFLKIRYPEFVSHYLSDINLPKFTNVITLVLDFSKKGKWDIKNLRNHFDGLKQLEGLKSFELSSDLWGNVRVKRIHFLRDLILAMPKTIHSLKLHKIAADTYGQAIADAFPSLKEFQIFSDESWSSIRSYYSEDAINPEEDNDLQQEDIEGELLQLNLEDEQQVDIDQRDIVDPDVEHNLGDQVIAEDDIERVDPHLDFENVIDQLWRLNPNDLEHHNVADDAMNEDITTESQRSSRRSSINEQYLQLDTVIHSKFVERNANVHNRYFIYKPIYFLPFQNLEILSLNCLGHSNFEFPPKIRILRVICTAQENTTLYEQYNEYIVKTSIPELTRFLTKSKIFELHENNGMDARICSCNILKPPFQSIAVLRDYCRALTCVNLRQITDWDLYVKLFERDTDTFNHWIFN